MTSTGQLISVHPEELKFQRTPNLSLSQFFIAFEEFVISYCQFDYAKLPQLIGKLWLMRLNLHSVVDFVYSSSSIAICEAFCVTVLESDVL